MEIIGLPEKDPNTSRLFVLLKVDSIDAKDLRDGMKKFYENPEDPDDSKKMKRLEIIANATKEAWKITNPS